jgi:hypothetical protein
MKNNIANSPPPLAVFSRPVVSGDSRYLMGHVQGGASRILVLRQFSNFSYIAGLFESSLRTNLQKTWRRFADPRIHRYLFEPLTKSRF